MISDIMHIVAHDNGKPAERRGRKTTGLRDSFLGQRGYRIEQGQQVYNNANKRTRAQARRIRDLHYTEAI